MQDLYGQYGRGPTLIERKRGFGLPVVMASGATAIALAGFFVVAALGRNEPAEPLPPRSTPLEAVKAPTESVTGSLMKVTELTPAAERRAPPPVSAAAPAPAPPQPAPAPAPTPLIEAQPPAPPAPAPTVVASAEISTTLPSPIPPLTAPPTAPPLATPQAPAPTPVVNTPPPAPPKPRTGPSQAEVTAFTNRANDLIKSGDVAGARLLLERAASGEDGASLLALAETYDPAVLNRWGVIGVRPDVEKARRLYQKAADHGVAAAKERMLALR
jgi:hypothetical protein